MNVQETGVDTRTEESAAKATTLPAPSLTYSTPLSPRQKKKKKKKTLILM